MIDREVLGNRVINFEKLVDIIERKKKEDMSRFFRLLRKILSEIYKKGEYRCSDGGKIYLARGAPLGVYMVYEGKAGYYWIYTDIADGIIVEDRVNYKMYRGFEAMRKFSHLVGIAVT